MERMARSDAAGFTLLELLVVIGIISMLMIAFLPDIIGASTEGDRADTEARIQFLVQAAKSYERKAGGGGNYPSDSFDHAGKTLAKDNGTNTGIESLVAALCQQRLGSDSIADHEDWLANTDGDQALQEIPLLQRRDLVEVVDAWGVPLVYFHNSGYDRPQRVVLADGDTVQVKALINPRTGKAAAPRAFQIFSAGPDTIFGTDDDITHPALVEEE